VGLCRVSYIKARLTDATTAIVISSHRLDAVPEDFSSDVDVENEVVLASIWRDFWAHFPRFVPVLKGKHENAHHLLDAKELPTFEAFKPT
jgi:hypothetical protein